jgi:hypothetical protein
MLDKPRGLCHSGLRELPYIWSCHQASIGDSSIVGREPLWYSRRDPLHRRNPRSLKNLAILAGGYFLTGGCFWLAVSYGSQHDYVGVAFGICGGLFLGLGCVLLT